MTMKVQVIEDSIWEGTRLTTMQLKYPRFIHAELMTHRVFSRNASSSRAIPVERMLQSIQEDPATFIHWGKNQPGMQAHEEIDEAEKKLAQALWHAGMKDAISIAESLHQLGLHKQVVNRIVEPWMHINVVVTATDWQNFFDLRCHKDAEPNLQHLAYMMRDAYNVAEPLSRNYHLPYIKRDPATERPPEDLGSWEDMCMISSARCARVSYLTHDMRAPDAMQDLDLATKLLGSKHMSPFEHVAAYAASPPPSGYFANFKGWQSFRNAYEEREKKATIKSPLET